MDVFCFTLVVARVVVEVSFLRRVFTHVSQLCSPALYERVRMGTDAIHHRKQMAASVAFV